MNLTFGGSRVVCTFFAASLFIPFTATAQNPPPDPIFDLATSSQHTGVLTSYVNFNTSFVADNSNEFVSFAFRETPAYFAFDDASVTAQGSSTNLLADPGFEAASFGQNCNHNNSLGCPPGWGAWIQPVDVSAIGQVATATDHYGCGSNGPHSGNAYWCDGSVQGYDAVYQELTGLTPGSTYNVSFWLGDNSGVTPNEASTSSQVDMLVYAGDNLPVGSVSIGGPGSVPEPGPMGLLAVGFAGLLFGAKRLRSSAR
jgi:hypothetical protein